MNEKEAKKNIAVLMLLIITLTAVATLYALIK